MKDDLIRKAFETWEELSHNPEAKFAFESRLKNAIDDEAKIADAKHAGEEKGIEKGIEKGKEKGEIEVVKNMFENGLTIDEIVKYSWLSKEKVKSIQAENKQHSDLKN